MTGKFRKGMVCITQNCRDPSANGMEVTLLSDYREIRDTETGDYVWAYYVDIIDDQGIKSYAFENQLRLKFDGGDMTFDELMKSLDTPVEV